MVVATVARAVTVHAKSYFFAPGPLVGARTDLAGQIIGRCRQCRCGGGVFRHLSVNNDSICALGMGARMRFAANITDHEVGLWGSPEPGRWISRLLLFENATCYLASLISQCVFNFM